MAFQQKNSTLVMKFGGTSVGTPEAMRQVVSSIINEKSNWNNLVVVTSALSGVTDSLLRMAAVSPAVRSKNLDADANQLFQRHVEIADQLIANEFEKTKVLGEIKGILDHIVNLCQAFPG